MNERKEAICRKVYARIGYDTYEFDLDKYIERTILAYPFSDGGIVVWEQQGIGWIDMAWTTKQAPHPRTLKKLIGIMALTDLSYLAADISGASNQRYTETFLRKMGFQEVGVHLFSIKL